MERNIWYMALSGCIAFIVFCLFARVDDGMAIMAGMLTMFAVMGGFLLLDFLIDRLAIYFTVLREHILRRFE